MNNLGIQKGYKPKIAISEKDKSARERAIEFARNIPKPR